MSQREVKQTTDGEGDGNGLPDWILMPIAVAAFAFVGTGVLTFAAYLSMKERFTTGHVDESPHDAESRGR